MPKFPLETHYVWRITFVLFSSCAQNLLGELHFTPSNHYPTCTYTSKLQLEPKTTKIFRVAPCVNLVVILNGKCHTLVMCTWAVSSAKNTPSLH